MLPSTFALSNTLTRLDATMNEAEDLLRIGQRDVALNLIMQTSDEFITILSQFDEGYFSFAELEKIEAYKIILDICSAAQAATNEDEYDPYKDDEGDTIYEW